MPGFLPDFTRAQRNPFDQFDQANPFDQFDDGAPPTSDLAADLGKRAGRSMTRMPGDVVTGQGNFLAAMERILRASSATEQAVEQIRRGGDVDPIAANRQAWAAPTPLGDTVAAVGREMRDRPTFAGLDAAYDGALAPDPKRDGQILPMAADSVGSLAAAFATPGGVLTKTATGTLLQAGGQAEQAREFLLARGADETEADAEAARQFVANIPAGMVESVAWSRLVGRFGGASLLKAVDEKWGKTVAQRILRTTLEQAGIEAGEEAVQQIWGNLTAKIYNPEQRTMEGVPQAMAVGGLMGGGTGGTLQAMAEALAPKKEVRDWNDAMANPQRPPQNAPVAPVQAQAAPAPSPAVSAPEAPPSASTPAAPSIEELVARAEAQLQAEKEAVAKEVAAREERVAGTNAKREQFGTYVAKAAEVLSKAVNRNQAEARPGFGDVQPLWNVLNYYLQDNSVGLTREQKAEARQTIEALQPLWEQLQAERTAENDERIARDQLERQEKELAGRAARKAESQRLARIEATGRDETGAVADLKGLPLEELQTLEPTAAFPQTAIDAEVERRMRAEMEGGLEEETGSQDDLLTVLREIRLPGSDTSGLDAELQELRKEWVNFGNRQQFFGTAPGSLDRVAERLRERGFDDIQTPADVIEAAKQAFAGKTVLPTWRDRGQTGQEPVEFARDAARRVSFVAADEFGTERIAREKLAEGGGTSLVRKADMTVILGENGQPIGTLGFADNLGLAHLYIKPEHRRSGYAQTALRKLLTDRPGKFGPPSVKFFMPNEASLPLLRKVGDVKYDEETGIGWLTLREDPEFARTAVSPLGFYDTVLEALQTWQGRGTPEQLRAHLAKTKGTKEESDWIGLDKFLEGKTSVTKAEVEDFVAQNAVKVEEVEQSEQALERLRERGEKAERAAAEHLSQSRRKYGDDSESWPDDVLQAQQILDLEADRLLDDHHARDRAPAFEDYTLPGGQNYRELLLTLPTRDAWTTELKKWATQRGINDIAQAEAAFERANGKTQQTWPQNFRSGHFRTPNILAHVRFNERTDKDGQRVLFLEEIQSDWHQKGRRDGYNDGTMRNTLRNGIRLEKATEALLEESGAMGEVGDWIAVETNLINYPDRGGRQRITNSVTPTTYPPSMTPQQVVDAIAADLADMDKEAVDDFIRKVPTGEVPDAPFKSSWPKLALKRMIRWAAENGFDRIAWTTGDQQAQRYDLSKRIGEIHYSGTNLTAYGLAGEVVISRTGVTPEQLPDLIGKDAADKLMTQTPQGTLRSLSGVDLKIGGEGMRGFYDRALVQIANELGKRYGAKVEQSTMVTPADQAPGAVDDGAKRVLRRIVDDGFGMTEAETKLVESDDYDGEMPYILSASRMLGAMENDGLTYMQARRREAEHGDRIQAHRIIELIGTTLDGETTNATVHALTIPPAMKADVLQGQPLFARGGAQATTSPDEIRMADFEARFRRIAPGLWDQYRVLVGDPELLLQLGVRRDVLTGTERAAYLARRRVFWFLQQNMRAGKDGLLPERLRRDILHEAGHAFLDTLEPDQQADLQRQWQADLKAKDGWLASMRRQKVTLRAGVETSWKEYWVERMAQENERWAARREGAVAHRRPALVQLAYEFRVWLQEALELLRQAFRRTNRYNVDFRAFLSGSRETEAPAPEATPQPIAAARMPAIPTYWLDPKGRLRPLRGQDHEGYATNVIGEKFFQGREFGADELARELPATAELFKRGWVRVVGWPDRLEINAGPYGRATPLNAAQRRTLEDQAFSGREILDANTNARRTVMRAQRRAEFARERDSAAITQEIRDTEQRLEALQESNEPADEVEAQGKALSDRLQELRRELVAAQREEQAAALVDSGSAILGRAADPAPATAPDNSPSTPEPAARPRVFDRIGKEKRLETVYGKGSSNAKGIARIVNRWKGVMPTFQGGKQKMAEAVTIAVRTELTPAERSGVDTIVDYFGGGGSWGLFQALANFQNTKRLVVHEYDADRLEKIRWLHESGDQIDAALERLKATLDKVVEIMNDAGVTSGSALAARLNQVGLEEDVRDLKPVITAIKDYARANFGSVADESGEKSAAMKRENLTRNLAEQAKGSFRGAREFRAGGGTIDYVGGDSFAQTPLPGPNVLAVVDPPYYKTKDYTDDVVGLDTYVKTHDLLAKLVEARNTVIYTDEAWWTREPKHGVPSLPDPSGERVLTSIVDFFSRFDVVAKQIASRWETLGIHHGTDTKSGIQRLAGLAGNEPARGGPVKRRVAPARGVSDDAKQAVLGMAGRAQDEAEALRDGSDRAGGLEPLDPKQALLQQLADYNERALAFEGTRGSKAAKQRLLGLRAEIRSRLDSEHPSWRAEQPELARGTGTRVVVRQGEPATPVGPKALPSDTLVDSLEQAVLYRATTAPIIEQLDRDHPGWRETPKGVKYLIGRQVDRLEALRRDGPEAELEAAKTELRRLRDLERAQNQPPTGTPVDPHPTSQRPIDPADAPPTPEPAPGDGPAPAREFDTRPTIYGEVEGHTWQEPTWLQRKWDYIARIFRLIGGPVPELPVFADDKEQRWSRFKSGVKMLRRGTPRIRREAAETIGRIVEPLLKAAPMPADDYARLQRLQQTKLRLRAENKPVPVALEQELEVLRLEAERHPYGLFQSLVLYHDLRWRAQNLMDDVGNPIVLTAGINLEEINARLQDLRVKVAASPHADLINRAFADHMALVKATVDDLKKRDLLQERHLANPFYFPHVVLDPEGKARGGALEKVKTDTAADFRQYLQRPVGSTRPIETDYTKAMFYHLVAVGSHNLRTDIVQDYWKPYDEMEAVRARAKELAQEYGRPVSWAEAFHTEWEKAGYVKWAPDDRLPLHPDLAIDRDTLARRIGKVITEGPLKPQLEQLRAQGIHITADDIREVLVADAKEVWIVPKELATALDATIGRDSSDHHHIETIIAKPFEMFNSFWKVTKLYAPWNYPRYEFNNTVADLEKLFSADPKVFSYLSQAAKEVREFIEKGKGGQEVREAFKRGVLDSVTAAELGDLATLREFEGLQTKRQRMTRAAMRRASTLGLAGDRTTVDLSRLREATFRFAKFKADVERMRAGARPVYAGAFWRDIEAMGDTSPGSGDAIYNKAAEISLATFGDYQNISPLGGYLRRYLVPFYSWQEINFRYHANLFRNLKDMVAAGELANAQALAQGASAAVAATSLSSRVAAGVLVRLALPYVVVALWNNLMFRDLEDGLSEEDKRRFHIIIGKDAEGKTMVVYGQTALADVVRWFSGQEAARGLIDVLAGRETFTTAVGEWVDRVPRDFANNLAQFFGPVGRAAYTAAAKKDIFPDVTNQRTIAAHDVGWAVLAQMTDQLPAELIRRTVDKDYVAPRDFGDWAKQAVLQVRKRDPEQWSYFAMRDKAADFLFQTEGRRRGPGGEDKDMQLLRNFRRSIYKGDVAEAMRFYDRLLEAGYTAERLRSSIQAQDPLADLPKDRRRAFVEQLSRLERWQLQQAYRYYTRMAELRGAERALFPTEDSSDAYRQNFRPRTERLEREIEATERLSEEELNARAEAELRRSLRPARR
jgi:hypothetical protein